MKCFPLVDIFLTMTAAEGGGGGGALSALFFVHSIRDNFIGFITCRVARGTKHIIMYWWVAVQYGGSI